MMTDINEIKRYANIELARRDFFHFCKLMIPDFYKDDRAYLVKMCETLQKLYEGTLKDKNGKTYHRLIINCPP